ncbi:MAG: mechanosensitive ion channel [Myxococcales bacterium]|nr:mechanosensitive ion channel [Myxococcales bacterium]
MANAFTWIRGALSHPASGRVISALLLIGLFWLIARGLRGMLLSKVKDTGVRYRTRKLIDTSLIAVIALILATTFSDKLGGIAVSLGVMGAGVAFALQEVIASVAGRVAILFARFYDVGDRVQLGGIKGDVIDIGLLRTTVMELGAWVDGDNYCGRIVRIANSFVFKEPVFNYSADFGFVWDEVKIPVRYGSPLAESKQLLETALVETVGGFVEGAREEWQHMTRHYRIEDARVDPMVTLQATDNWLEYSLRYVVPFTKRRTTKDVLFERIVRDVEASQGKVQLGSATYELVAAPPLRVIRE